MINEKDFIYVKPDKIEIKNNISDETFYDIEVENDHDFYIVTKNDNLLLTHNCDGYHIKGLLINLFDTFWPELLELDFIYEFITPIVRATKGKSRRFFYKLHDYRKFRDGEKSKGYFFKYYKGLGTIDANESKLFFKNLKKHLIRIEDSDRDVIDLVFKNKRADERKQWLLNYKPDLEWDKFSNKTTIESFFNNEFIEFSMYDNIRSIPSMVDGLKPSHRKILYTMFKKNFKNEIKVSQFCGSVIEMAAYHHGPQSLEQSVVNMAQDFVGSNNINLLQPLGQFGTRVHGGSEAAASRYISTQLSDITRNIFMKEDDNILQYINEDGQIIEPTYYLPVIPMLLVNGAKGIGTGYSTDIPQFNHKDIIKWYKAKIEGKKLPSLIPSYNNFKGKIEFNSKLNKYVTTGIYKIESQGVRITELPIGMWNEKFLTHLDKLVDDKKVKDYVNNCTDTEVDILVKLDDLEMNSNIIKLLKLESDLKMTNMIAFNAESKLQKYENVNQILEDFYSVRYKGYEERKEYLIEKVNKEKKIIMNRGNFVQAILTGKLQLNNKPKSDVISQLQNLNIEEVDDGYDYLLNMNILSLTKEKLDDLKKQFTDVKSKLKELKDKTIEEMWLEDLSKI